MGVSMFETFRNVWTPVEFSRCVTKRRPVAARLAGEDLVLFRNAEGRVGVLRDRCPHRGVKLSLGAMTPDGCLACPFHGWEFKTDGACQHVPYAPMSDEKRERNHATALPARDVGGMIWVFT